VVTSPKWLTQHRWRNIATTRRFPEFSPFARRSTKRSICQEDGVFDAPLTLKLAGTGSRRIAFAKVAPRTGRLSAPRCLPEKTESQARQYLRPSPIFCGCGPELDHFFRVVPLEIHFDFLRKPLRNVELNPPLPYSFLPAFSFDLQVGGVGEENTGWDLAPGRQEISMEAVLKRYELS